MVGPLQSICHLLFRPTKPGEQSRKLNSASSVSCSYSVPARAHPTANIQTHYTQMALLQQHLT